MGYPPWQIQAFHFHQHTFNHTTEDGKVISDYHHLRQSK
jgi:hypothetical protein